MGDEILPSKAHTHRIAFLALGGLVLLFAADQKDVTIHRHESAHQLLAFIAP
jgi:hypothetical protein